MGVLGKVKSLGKKVFKYSPLGFTVYQFKYAAKKVRKWLTPKIPDFGSGSTAQDYRLEARGNVPARNSPQNEHFGIGRRWPEYKSQPWSYFRKNNQVLCQLFFIGVGEYEIEDWRVGMTSLSAYPGFEIQVCDPDEPVTLFHCNVFNNEEVSNIELVTGALYRETFFNDNVGFHTDGTIDLLDGQFNNIRIGSSVNVSGTATHDGDYEVVDADSGGDWIVVDPPFLSNTTESATFSFDRFDGNANALKIEGVAITVTTTPRRIAAPVDTFINIREGDEIVTIGAGDNDNLNFKVTGVAGNGAYVNVSPTPADAGAFTADIMLLRRWQGPYPVCPAEEKVDKISIDLIFSQGLGALDGDKTDARTVTAAVEVREIDDDGNPITPDWTPYTFDITDSSKDPVRVTVDIIPAAPLRAQVRLARASGKSDEPEVMDVMEWGGLRGFIVERPGEVDNVFPGVTVVAVKLTASGTMSTQNQGTLNALISRKLPAWNGTTFTAPEVTNSIAWAHLYLLRKCGIPDAQIDLAGHLAAHTDWTARGWTFTHDFDGDGNVQEARRLMLRCGRATPTRDPVTGIYGFRRDEPRSPVQMFTDLNSSDAGDFSCRMIDGSMPTGMVLEYMDLLTWTPKEITIGDADTKPARDRLEGCTSRQHAWEILYFEWFSQRYRTQSIPVDGEMEPILLNYDDAALIQCAEQGWGQGARLVSAAGSTLTVWPPLDWSGTGHHVFLRDPNGAPGAQISVTRGSGDDKVILGSPADVELITGDSEERTIIAFGSSLGAPVVALVRGVQWSLGDNGGLAGSLDTVLEDARVFDDPGDAPD